MNVARGLAPAGFTWNVFDTILLSQEGYPSQVGAGFGFSVLWADTDNSGYLDLVVGAPRHDVAIAGSEEGKYCLFRASTGQASTWPFVTFADPTPNPDERFGAALSKGDRWGSLFQRDDIVVGAFNALIPESGFTGEAFVYRN
ncbi:MAG: integrin alpha [Planctomycetota bacterium]